MITIPSLNDVTDIADSDVVMITNSQGESFKLAGSEINKRGKIIIANGTTITGAPLKAGSSVRVYFTVDLTAANASTTLQLNYNNVNYYVKAPKDGTLINFVATNLGGSPAVYKYLQKYTTLELLFDGTQFVIIGNPVILSSADYTIYADGSKKYTSTIFPYTVTPVNRVVVWDDLRRQKDTQTASSHTEVPVPNYTPILIYIWNPANVAQFIIARVFSQGQNGSFTVFHNAGFTISSVNNSKVTVNTDLGHNLSYKYIV